jgi:hypothetical protein
MHHLRRRNPQAQTSESLMLRQCVPTMSGDPKVPVAAEQHWNVGTWRRFWHVFDPKASGNGDVS